ncbi:CopD family protein [Winogradskyella jejuensis]|uniref:Copper resistance protein D n=1 Tax=Winogradskyella jejuensis TaxID=1089305 RepID=A0A1M5KQL2_9FLAO|nr:CopD family protein [Winogradskyella jejuensis]SHG55051.1 Copper resistance protein D [Winogradskyella jejuensis]
MIKAVVFLHIVSATIWTGGHLILSLGFLPAALKRNDFSIIEAFESRYERIGIPSLIILLATGVYMTIFYAPNLFEFDLYDHYSRHIILKYSTLIVTILLAIHARFFLIPKRKLKPLAFHIVAVTILAVFFVFLGYSARSGGLL